MAITTTASFAKQEGDDLLHRVTGEITRSAKSQGVEEMHDLRVAIRRFRRILSALKPCFPRNESKRMRRALKAIMVQAGNVRNYDIATHLITRMELPESGTLLRQLQKRREMAALALSATLHRWTSRNLPAIWRAALKSDRDDHSTDAAFRAVPIEITAKRILPDMVAQHFRRGEAAVNKNMPAHRIHRFRIAAKNFRYTLDFFSPLYADSLSVVNDHLKEVQTLLGDINDCVTVRRIVKDEVTTESDQAVREKVLAGLKKRQRKKISEFRAQFAAEFASASTLRQWQDSIRRIAAEKNPTARSAAKRRRG
jgi:triphosphatase